MQQTMTYCATRSPSFARLDDVSLEETIRALQSLAHPVRLRIVESIARHQGELCVCQIQDGFDLTQPTISHHLKVLRDAGMLATRQDGTWVHYRLADGALDRITRVLDSLASGVDPERVPA